MDKKYQLLSLLRSGLTGEAAELPADTDLAALASMAKKSGVLNLFYYGAVNCGFPQEGAVMENCFLQVCAGIAQSERQTLAIEDICKAFSENGIDYLPLKGTILKKLYPQSDMRPMGDADILIRPGQADKIRPVLTALGFTESPVYSDHEWIWKSPNLFLELHKRLIPSYNKDYYAYFGDGWQLAKPTEDPYRYTFSPEDQFIYLFTHFAKHYRDGGIGVRHMLDLWVYLHSVSALDKAYIAAELEKLQLNVFCGNILDTLAVWFDGKAPTEVTGRITDFIFDSASFGKHENHVASAAVRITQTQDVSNASARRVRFWRVIFPTAKSLQGKYPTLGKYPWLLPVFWVVRWFDALLHPNKIEKQKKNFSQMSDTDVEAYAQSLAAVGLQFNFKE